jgi:hypothetical protein
VTGCRFLGLMAKAEAMPKSLLKNASIEAMSLPA